MSHAEHFDRLFAYATGWLGWTAEAALATPMPQIEAAIRAKLDFIAKTSPFGGGPRPEPASADRPDRAAVAERLRTAFRALAATGQRRGG